MNVDKQTLRENQQSDYQFRENLIISLRGTHCTVHEEGQEPTNAGYTKKVRTDYTIGLSEYISGIDSDFIVAESHFNIYVDAGAQRKGVRSLYCRHD